MTPGPRTRPEAWLLVGRRPSKDDGSPFVETFSALHDAGIATLTVDLPSGGSAAAECVRAAADEIRREIGDIPVAYLGQGKAAAAGWVASLSGDLDGMIAWNGRIGSAWSKLGQVSVPSLLVVDESESGMPWNLFVARVASRRLDRAELDVVSKPQDEIDRLAAWYRDRILSPSPLAAPAGIERGRTKRSVARIGAAAAIAVPCIAAATVQAGSAGAALPDFGAGHTLSAAQIAGDNAAFAPTAPHTRKPEKNKLGSSEIRGDNVVNPFATGSQPLIDNAGVKYFINTDITFSTSSSASGAMSEASYTHAVSASTLNGGTTQSTLNDAYDGYNTMCISDNNTVATCETGNANFQIYNKNGPATTECLGSISGVNRQVDFPVQTVGNLQMSRKVFVPDNDAFARWLDVLKNTGGSPITETLVIANNLGSDSNTVITGSSSGDQAAQTSDTWVSTFQNYSGTTSSDPRLGHVLQGAGASVPLAGVNFANGDDNPYWGYTLTLQPGQTRILMNFAAVQPSKAASMSKSASLASLADTHALDCMTPTEKGEIANFPVTGNLVVTKKLISNSADPAKFNLKIDGTTYAANVGNNGTTGAVAVTQGTHTVSETAGTNANLGNYQARISCSDGSAAYATSLSGIHVTNGSTTYCTITNTRRLFKAGPLVPNGVRGPPHGP